MKHCPNMIWDINELNLTKTCAECPDQIQTGLKGEKKDVVSSPSNLQKEISQAKAPLASTETVRQSILKTIMALEGKQELEAKQKCKQVESGATARIQEKIPQSILEATIIPTQKNKQKRKVDKPRENPETKVTPTAEPASVIPPEELSSKTHRDIKENSLERSPSHESWVTVESGGHGTRVRVPTESDEPEWDVINEDDLKAGSDWKGNGIEKEKCIVS